MQVKGCSSLTGVGSSTSILSVRAPVIFAAPGPSAMNLSCLHQSSTGCTDEVTRVVFWHISFLDPALGAH